jgi:hypothetical protein
MTTPTSERTWTIYDIDGSNPRTVTLEQYLAMVKTAADTAKAIHTADVRQMHSKRGPNK